MDKPDAALIETVSNKEVDFNMKPHGGFWTSSWIEKEQKSDWVRWCISEDFENSFECAWYLLEVREDARIYTIDSLHDLFILWETYPRVVTDWAGSMWMDWEAIAREWDGVHLTEKGNAECHLSSPIDLNCWDVESTVWFRWVFTSVEKITPPVVLEGAKV